VVIYKSEAQERLRRAANEIVHRIIAGFAPDRILLFGSVRRKEAGPGRDIDLLIVKDTVLPFKERSAMLYGGIDRDEDVEWT
jgi:predicted nucleotidyltransferase